MFLDCFGSHSFFSDAPSEYQEGLANGFMLHEIWNLSFIFFANLLISTGIWFGISILLTIFLISKQPLEVELSSRTIEKFRGLSMLALWFSFFYFLAITIGITTALADAPALSLLDIILSPFLFFIAIGVVSVLFPFYNIHKTLLRSKTQGLLKIEEELALLQRQLDEILAGRPSRRLSDQTIAIVGRLSSLQIKERNVRAAQEWPIDIGFLSKLVGLVLLPIVSRILMEILNSLLMT